MNFKRSPLGQTQFRNFISARFLFTLSMQIQFVSIAWFVYQLTKDPMALGFIGLFEAIPAISLSLLAGQWVDKLEKKSTFIVLTSIFWIVSVVAFGLVYAYSNNYISTEVCLKCIYCIVFLNGIKRSMLAPTIGAYWPSLVSKIWVPKASATNSMFWQLAAIIGPIVGSYLIAKYAIVVAFLSVVLLMPIAIILLFKLPRAYPVRVVKYESVQRRIVEGLQFVYTNKIMLGAMSLDLFSVFFAGVEAMIPVFAEEILKVGPTGFGWLRAAPSLGSFLILSYLAFVPSNTKTGKKLLFCVIAFGVSTLVFGLSNSFFLSFIMLFLSGIFDGFSVVVRGTINQLLTPDHIRGRVSAVNSMFISSSNELGAVESGFAAKTVGLVTSVVIGSCSTIVIVFGIALSNPELRNFEIANFTKKTNKIE